eukprot:jgi/Orpsp1_1/1184203/evm.model.c7180000088470.1
MPDSGESEKSIYLFTDASSSDESLLIHKNSKDEEKKKISFISLYRYSGIIEKIMIFFGIVGAIGQGLSLPLAIKILGKLINLFISLVESVNIRNLIGIHDNDELVQQFLGILTSKNQTSYDIFSEQYPEIDISKFSNIISDKSIASRFKSSEQFWSDFHYYIILLSIITVVSFVGSFLMDALLNISAMRQITRIRSLSFQSIIRQDISWHETKNPGELASRIISDSILIEDGIGYNVGTVIHNLVTFLACFGLALKSGWKLSLYMSVIFPIILVFGIFMAVVLKYTTTKSQDVFAELGGIAYEAFSQIRTIVSFGTEQKEIDRYVDKLALTKKYGIIMGNGLGMCLGLILGIIYSSFSIAFIFGTRFINNGEMIYGDVLSVFMGIMMGSMTLSNIAMSLGEISQASAAAVTLFNIIEKEPSIKLNEGIVPEKPLDGTIEFQDVHFNYPSRPDVEVLKGISFKCNPGQTVALVGSSGSGKSTSIQLLERYYNKSSGRILIDGRDIEDYNVQWLRSQIGIVSQEPTLFDVSISQNIAINSPNATQEQIEEVAKLSNAHSFIKNLSNGYETSAGERGLLLSGGQKQRICIARALINNPKILLLDEATSALDNKSEKIVQDALDSASSGRTTLIIAHRLSTVKNADLIIVMEKGEIVESGTHEELMSLQKYYYDLVKNQEIMIKEEDDDDSFDDSVKDPNMVHQIPYDNTCVQNHRESTVLSRIASTILSRRQTTGAFSELSNYDEPDKTNTFISMPWKKYIHYNKPYWFKNLLGFIGALFSAIVQPAFAYIFSSALNVFTKKGDELIDGGFYWGMMFILLGFCNFIAFNFKFGRFFAAGESLCFDLRKEMYDSMIRQEIGFFDTNEIGDKSDESKSKSNKGKSGSLIAKLYTEGRFVRKFNATIGSVFELIVTIISCFSIAFYNSWKLTLILILAVPMIAIGSFISIKNMKVKNQRSRDLYEKSSDVACEVISNIKTVYALNLSDYFSKLYDQKLKEPYKLLEHKAYISAIGTGFSNSVIFVAFTIGLWTGAIFIENGEIEFLSMFKVIMALVLTAMSFGQNNILFYEADKAMESFINIMDIIERKPKIDARNPNGIKKDASSFNGSLEFCELRFRYPSRPKVTVLRMGNKKITIPSGKMCAFVGASGSGKSTILGLLPRWYDASHGSVKVDGEENKDYNIKWLREQIGIVNQEPCLFNISIKENIKYGKLDATDEEVYEAAKKANIHDFIMSLPEKYDTLVGGIGTSQMSGGQKQRIAIARAMIRNPKILLLDEATSALDAESELIVQKALEDASEGRTTITIAHRLSTIKNADIICVFKEGSIIEIGNHEELMETKGEYYNMVVAGDGGISKSNSVATLC